MNNSTKVLDTKVPLIRVVKRDTISLKHSILIRAAFIFSGLALCALFMYSVTKMNPFVVYSAMFEGALGGTSRVWATLKDVSMLLCIAVALAPAFKMRFWNIGAEGQVLIGAVAAAFFMKFCNGLPNFLLLFIMLVGACAAGALWGMIPAIFKSKWKTNETLFTLMMNYCAIQITAFCVVKWERIQGSNTVGIINLATGKGWLPKVFGQEYVLNFIIVITVTVLMFIYLKYTKHGYEISVVGESENTAKYAGINIPKVFIRTMLISGTICGLAGFITVSGASNTISTGTAGGNGFTAIIVAWLAKFNTLVMLSIAFLIVFLERGSSELVSKFDFNSSASKIISSIILFSILASEFLINYRLVIKGKEVAI